MERFAHEPNLVYGTRPGLVALLGTSYPTPPASFPNCSHGRTGENAQFETAPARNTYLWTAATPEGLAQAPRRLAIDAPTWDYDPLHNGAICDTNAAGAVPPNSSALVGLWRRCETSMLHTVPHTFTAANVSDATSYSPNISDANMPFLAHAGAEDPMVFYYPGQTNAAGVPIFHALLHDEQQTRCMDGPVGCWPGGRHAFSADAGATWDYAPLDAYNGSVAFTDGSTAEFFLRARPHLLLEGSRVVALSTGVRPIEATDYVFTLVQPVH